MALLNRLAGMTLGVTTIAMGAACSSSNPSSSAPASVAVFGGVYASSSTSDTPDTTTSKRFRSLALDNEGGYKALRGAPSGENDYGYESGTYTLNEAQTELTLTNASTNVTETLAFEVLESIPVTTESTTKQGLGGAGVRPQDDSLIDASGSELISICKMRADMFAGGNVGRVSDQCNKALRLNVGGDELDEATVGACKSSIMQWCEGKLCMTMANTPGGGPPHKEAGLGACP